MNYIEIVHNELYSIKELRYDFYYTTWAKELLLKTVVNNKENKI